MSASPLSQSHIDMIRSAVVRSRKVRRGASIATASGWTLAVFALPALAFGFLSIPSALLGLLLGVVAWGEFKGARALRRFDAKAPKRLAMNQMLLGLSLSAYGGWGIFDALRGPSPMASAVAQAPELQRVVGSMEGYWTFGLVGFYVLFILLSIMATGATAFFYASRKHHIKSHLTATPQWVVDVQRAAA